MLKDSTFSGEESMQLINEMIGKAKRSYTTKGLASMVWGTLIISCSMVSWAKIKYNLSIGFDVWWLLIIALMPQIYFSITEKINRKFESHDEKTITYVWATFTICILITSFYDNKYGGQHSATLFMMLYGIPTFITGGIFKFKPMIIGGAICWVLSLISLYTGSAINMLLMAGCGLFAWLIPGIILWNRYKKGEMAHV